MSFVHLHVHSEYSMLDGLGNVKKLSARAKELGQDSLAITDHGVMHAAIEFVEAAGSAGIKPIIGMEGYLTMRGRTLRDREGKQDRSLYHMLLLAQNDTGYKNLMRMATIAQLEGFYYKPRLDHATLKEYAAGVIATTGCLAAEVPSLLADGQADQAREALLWYREIFGDRFYVELQDHDIPELDRINPTLVDWARELSIPLVLTNDSHYVKQGDSVAHDLMLCVQTTSMINDAKRMRFNNDSYYIKTEDEMRALCRNIPREAIEEAIANTKRIADQCNVKVKTKDFHLPHFKRPQRFASDNEYLRYLCEVGFEVRYGIPARADGVWVHEDNPPQAEDGFIAVADGRRKTEDVKSAISVSRPPSPVCLDDDSPVKLTTLSPLALPSADTHPAMTPRRLRERLDFELNTIIGMGFSAYMLIVWDLIRFCREAGIWWNVRGSAAGSMVSHVLMLTNIEPVSNDLYFERFLNPERVTMPDIDMDFPDDQRNRLVDYTIEKYGREQVAQIITFGTMQARAALKDVGRVTEVPLGEVNRLTSLVPNTPGKPVNLREALEQVPALKQLYDEEAHLKELYDRAILVEGSVRNAGTHAAGVVIADKPLIEYAPLHRLTGTPITPQLNAVTQFEMNHLESIGLLKMDYLGLSMLTIVRKACEWIEKRHGKRFTLNDIPIHEKIIYDTLSRGDVAGVFQVESSGMRNLMMDMKPKRFENIVAAISLYRPGPLEYIPTYNKRLHGEEPVQYHHPDLASSLGETYGIIVYQEQIMRVARDFAGYSMGEADTIRKAVSKKVKEQLDKHKNKFREGAIKKGYAGEIADQIWTDVEFFARYGFNKAHAADYAQITCQTAWLKATYPVEYFAALLSVESGNTEKIAALIADAKKHGLDVLAPDVNKSEEEFTIEDTPRKGKGAPQRGQAQKSAVRFGLMAIKNVGSGPVEAILNARKEGGPFRDINDFARRVDMAQINKRSLESLIKAGALDGFGPRHQLLAALDAIIGATAAARRAAERGQGMLFGGMDDALGDLVTLPANAPPIPRKELLMFERELIGTYVTEHPLAASLQHLQEFVTRNSGDMTMADTNQSVVVAGMVSNVKPHTTKAGKDMAFAEIEDLFGTIELIVFPKTWEKYQDKLVKDKIVVVWGKGDVKEGGSPKILVDRVNDSVMIARSADEPAPVAAPVDWYASAGSLPLADEDEDGNYAPPPPPNFEDEVLPTRDEAAPGALDEAYAAPPVPDMLREIRASYEPSPPSPGHPQPPAPAAEKQMAGEPDAPSALPDARDAGIVQIKVQTLEVKKSTGQIPIAAQPSKVLNVVIKRNGSGKLDAQRFEAAHQILTSFDGADRFAITLVNGGKKDATLDFPNHTTRDCVELRNRLREIGAECA